MPKDAVREGNQDFARWLTAERTRRRMTQNQVEKAIGASNGVVSRWSRGLAAPSPKYVHALAELWNADEDWLLTMIGYRSNQEKRTDLSSPRANLHTLLDKVELTRERIINLTSQLENMIEVDAYNRAEGRDNAKVPNGSMMSLVD